MSVLGNWLGRSIGHWFGQTASQPSNVIQPSGGWHWWSWGRRKRRRDEDELADALESHLIHTGVVIPETPHQKVLAFMSVREPDEIPKHVRDSILRAVRAQTAAAYSLALKRIREIEEEEDFVVLMALH